MKEFVTAALGAYDEAWWCLFRQIALLDVRVLVTITPMSFLLTLRRYYPSTPASIIILLICLFKSPAGAPDIVHPQDER